MDAAIFSDVSPLGFSPEEENKKARRSSVPMAVVVKMFEIFSFIILYHPCYHFYRIPYDFRRKRLVNECNPFFF